jgi:hypothetical protein
MLGIGLRVGADNLAIDFTFGLCRGAIGKALTRDTFLAGGTGIAATTAVSRISLQIHTFTRTLHSASCTMQLALTAVTDLILLTSCLTSSAMLGAALEIDTATRTFTLIAWTSHLALASHTDLVEFASADQAASTAIFVILLQIYATLST